MHTLIGEEKQGLPESSRTLLFHSGRCRIGCKGLFKYCMITFRPSLDPPSPLVIESDLLANPPSPPPLIVRYLNELTANVLLRQFLKIDSFSYSVIELMPFDCL